MADWDDLSEKEKHHANAFTELINSFDDAEQRVFNAIKQDLQKAKTYLEGHPRLKKTAYGVAAFAGLASAYVIKSHKLGPQLPPPRTRY